MNLFDIDNLEKELQSLEKKTTENGFWEDSKGSSSIILKKIKTIQNKCKKYYTIYNNISNLLEMSELLLTEYDEDLAKDIISNTASIRR